MDALHDIEPKPSFTGLACPDCLGTLEVTSEDGRVRFRCRIGHTYSLRKLIELKEARIEEALWGPTTGLEELSALLDDAVAKGLDPECDEEFRRRSGQAREQARSLRHTIERDEPTRFPGPW